MSEVLAINLVAITQEISRRRLVWEGAHDLLGGSDSGGVLGHVEVDDAPVVVSEHDEDEKDAEAGGGHGKEVIESKSEIIFRTLRSGDEQDQTKNWEGTDSVHRVRRWKLCRRV